VELMRLKREPRTVLEVSISIAGYRKGLRVAMFIEQWTIAQRDLGHVPTLEEAAAWWKESERTWYHRLAEFREVFDLVDTPEPIASYVIEQQQVRDRGSVMAAVAPQLLQAA
jgi:hypothetical protein